MPLRPPQPPAPLYDPSLIKLDYFPTRGLLGSVQSALSRCDHFLLKTFLKDQVKSLGFGIAAGVSALVVALLTMLLCSARFEAP
jgi:hypothetical protein